MANWQDLFKAFLTNTNDITNTTTNPVAMGNPVATGVAQGAQNAIPWDRLLPLVFPSSHTDIAPQNDPMFGRGMDWNHFFVNHPNGGAVPVFQGQVKPGTFGATSMTYNPQSSALQAAAALKYNPFQVAPPNPLNDAIGGMFANLLKPKRNLYAGY